MIKVNLVARMRSKVPSCAVPSYTRAGQPVLVIFKGLAGNILDKTSFFLHILLARSRNFEWLLIK